ncbi:hypothetical protein B0I37DRAFT_385663 [Chaetomium sp. MPI-CAGE-AT-0009]|nr:hypothetical protein B0I37DRAFT_385663 [Chaetomium sp. MPI-CAGE-AT-0009]
MTQPKDHPKQTHWIDEITCDEIPSKATSSLTCFVQTHWSQSLYPHRRQPPRFHVKVWNPRRRLPNGLMSGPGWGSAGVRPCSRDRSRDLGVLFGIAGPVTLVHSPCEDGHQPTRAALERVAWRLVSRAGHGAREVIPHSSLEAWEGFWGQSRGLKRRSVSSIARLGICYGLFPIPRFGSNAIESCNELTVIAVTVYYTPPGKAIVGCAG